MYKYNIHMHSKKKISKPTKPTKQTKQNQNIFPVFRLKIWSKNSVECKHIGNVEDVNKLTDEQLELVGQNNKNKQYGVYTAKICNIGTYEIFLRACMCNILGNYLVSNSKYPIMYVTVIYASQLVTGQLFTKFLYFTLDDECKTQLVKPSQYVNRILTGKYTLELVGDDALLANVIDKKTSEIEESVMKTYQEQFENASIEEKDTICAKISEDVEIELEKYRDLFNVKDLKGFPQKKRILESLENELGNDLFKDLINVGLQMRQDERIKEKCENPKRVIDLKLFKEHPEKIQEFVDNLSDYENESD